MMRYFPFPADPIIKVGLLSQSSLGIAGKRIFENLTIEKKN